MRTFPVGKFKSDFSNILKDVQRGEEVAISFGKRKQTLAVLMPYAKFAKRSKTRKLGILQGKASFRLHRNFKMSDNEFLAA
jgi:prevent-host-death family protein